ncbi:MAG: endolytic transglycosylase MltG [Ruminococcus sp.]|nr:endolytic transglycosylase MltG [Ruminococcus sp.]
MDEKDIDFGAVKEPVNNDPDDISFEEDISFGSKKADDAVDISENEAAEISENAEPMFDLIDDAPEAEQAADVTAPEFDLIDDTPTEVQTDNSEEQGSHDEDSTPNETAAPDEAEDTEKAQETAPAPVTQRKPKKRSLQKKSSAKKKAAAETVKTTKKKGGPGFNNSIFGGLILVTIILTVSLVLAVSGIKISFEYLGIGKSEDNITFNIPENSTPDEIADILINNNIIENKTLFKIAMKFQHSPTLFPGDVTLNPSMGYATIIENLSYQRDAKETVRITFPEGVTLLDVASTLEEKGVIEKRSDFLFEFNKLQDFSFETLIDTSADTFYTMEGFFFPDTYEFYVGDSGYNVTRVVRANFADKYTTEIMTKLQQSDLTLSQVITLASIVQWEANSTKDMPKVASVFLNRLHDSDTFPKLQSDATAKYLKLVINQVADTASKEHFNPLYDTYICDGLPVGPVCNPGLDAILAVLEPADTNYYYFCNDLRTGESFFAETLAEHEENLIKAGLA